MAAILHKEIKDLIERVLGKDIKTEEISECIVRWDDVRGLSIEITTREMR